MTKEKLDALLANGSITQDEYDAMMARMELNEPSKQTAPDALDDEELEKRIKAQVDRITSKLGKEKADLQKQLEKLKNEKLTAEELKQLEITDKEKELEARERELLEKENRLYAIKAIKVAGLDDGSDNSLALVDFVLGEDTESIDARIKAFSELVKKFVKAEVDKTFKENGRTPKGSGSGGNTNNPYAPETLNLTEQMRLEVENPELAAKMKAAAGN